MSKLHWKLGKGDLIPFHQRGVIKDCIFDIYALINKITRIIINLFKMHTLNN